MAYKYSALRLTSIFHTNLLNQQIKTNLAALRCYSSYQTSKELSSIKPSVSKYDVERSPEEWQFVERLLPVLTVPKPLVRDTYNTNWTPPNANPNTEKYYVSRNRNHMIPVYIATTHRGMRKITEVVKVQGDIHALNQDLKNVIEKTTGKPVASQVNELVSSIKFKGDFVRIIHNFLKEKGF